MAMKDHSDEFKADAVALYESTPGTTHKSIAADLGINRATLRELVLRDRERRGVAAAASPRVTPNAPPAARSTRSTSLATPSPSTRCYLRVSNPGRCAGRRGGGKIGPVSVRDADESV
ncbi:transposase, partial [Streptomyces sp. NPDC005799]|uniref:transposase n=1 Tax=Streptomyces sp. NPDC005799 TaxID=3154678 RepID=UPI003409CFB7